VPCSVHDNCRWGLQSCSCSPAASMHACYFSSELLPCRTLPVLILHGWVLIDICNRLCSLGLQLSAMSRTVYSCSSVDSPAMQEKHHGAAKTCSAVLGLCGSSGVLC
jgi:hypothetical protein